MPSRAPALLDAIFEYAPIGLGFWDQDLRCVRINPALAEINGVPAGETVGRTLPEVLGALGSELESLLRGVLETGRPLIDTEVRGQTRARPGVARQWRATYYPVFGDDGEPIGVAASVLEVTGEQLAQSRAETATALLDAIVDAAPVGIAFLDLDLRYQRVNRAMAELVGRVPEEMVGRRPGEVAGEIGEKAERLLARARDTGEAVYEEELGGEVPGLGEFRYRAGSWFPVRGAGGEVVGVGAVVRDATERYQLDRERQRLFEEAVEARARAEQAQRQAEEARARTDFLAEASRRMATSMDYERTLQEVAQIVVPGMADWCTIVLKRPRGVLETIALAHSDPRKLDWAWELARRYPPQPDAVAGVGAVIRTGEPELTDGITPELLDRVAHDEEHRRILSELDMRSVLIVPLRTSDGVIGAVTMVVSGEHSRRFTPDDVQLARLLADRASLHIRNALLYRERTHVARTLQAGLLPRALPEIPGLDLAAAYRAAGDGLEVGGDFYDAFDSGEREWAVLIGDVVGKGPEAASVTALARHTLRTAALFEPEPREKLHALNRALLMEGGEPRFCTVLCGRITPEGSGFVARMATGGHPAPRVLRADGRIETPGLRGTLVGWLDEPSFAVADVHLAPGDLLLLFTDGVTEVRGRGMDFGERALAQALTELAGASAQSVADGLLERTIALHEGNVPDDIALLVLRVRP